MPLPANDTYAAIDLGSNSFHMVVARTGPKGLVTIDRLREPVRLADGLEAGGRLSLDARERALAALGRFAGRLRGLPESHVRAVGTNALRMASDAGKFTERAQQVLGYRIDIIPGEEEAELIYRGALGSLGEPRDAILVFDIGGSSCEFAVGATKDPSRLLSLQLGCITLTDRCFPARMVNEQLLAYAREEVARLFSQHADSIFAMPFTGAYGTSGALGTLATLCESYGGERARIDSAGLLAIRKQLVEIGDFDEFVQLGISPDRAEVLAASLCIAECLVERLGPRDVEVIDAAIREGVLYQLVESAGGGR